MDLDMNSGSSGAEIKDETMEGTLGLTEKYGKYCDTGAASGQSACGQTSGDYCGVNAASGQCDLSSRTARQRGSCDAGAASGQSACGQIGEECDDWCCC